MPTTDTRKTSPFVRLQQHGPGVLTDAELVSLFIAGRSRDDALTAAEVALSDVGGLGGVLVREWSATYRPHGLTARSAGMIAAAHEIGRRVVAQSLVERDALHSPDDVRRYFAMQLTGLEHEVFSVLLLDNRHRVIEYRELFRGTIDSAAVYPREVAKVCLSRNAAACIFAHNHPSGVAEPSDTDVRLTRKLVDALALLDVRVLDHLVIGQGVQTSLAERGLM